MSQKNGMRVRGLLLCTIVVGIGLFLGGVSAWGVGDEEVIFYENTNYGGKQLKYSPGPAGIIMNKDLRTNPLVTSDGVAVNWNDKISSVSVGKNRKVVMYADISFKGANITFYGVTVCKNVTSGEYPSMPSGWNDRASSVVVIKNDLPFASTFSAEQAVVFEDINYCGDVKYFSVGEYPDLRQTAMSHGGNWNDKISSIRVGSNAILSPFEHINYGGASFTEVGPSDMPTLVASGWNDRISSLKLRKRI